MAASKGEAMKRLVVLLIALLCIVPIFAQQKDEKGCSDHPLLTRMPGYWIRGCKNSQFNAYDFFNGKNKPIHVEGQFWWLSYYPNRDLNPKVSDLQILRNYQNALTKLGAKLVAETKGKEVFQLTKDGKEIWIEVAAEFTGKYWLTIVQKEGMAQDVVADAAAMGNDLRATGHIALYGIYFDTNKSEVKPESKPALEEIAKLLAQNPGFKLKVVGHTDGTGALDANMKLSQARGEAVVKALVTQHGTAASRLKGYGVGPLAPIATNDTEDGRAKNRRVELVKE